MQDDRSGAYFLPSKRARRSARTSADARTGNRYYGRRRGGRGRAAGVLVAVLLILTAAICLLVVFLPRFSASVAGSAGFGGKTYYMLATAHVTDRSEAEQFAERTAEQGGAGYIYNDGEYRIVAAAYEREVDAKTLASVNPDCHYFALVLSPTACDEKERKALDYVVGEWFKTVDTAASELDRGNITESAAERATNEACKNLLHIFASAENDMLYGAVKDAVHNYENGARKSVLSNIRYLQIAVIAGVKELL